MNSTLQAEVDSEPEEIDNDGESAVYEQNLGIFDTTIQVEISEEDVTASVMRGQHEVYSGPLTDEGLKDYRPEGVAPPESHVVEAAKTAQEQHEPEYDGNAELAAKILEAEYLNQNQDQLDDDIDYSSDGALNSPLAYLGDDMFEDMVEGAKQMLDEEDYTAGAKYIVDNEMELVDEKHDFLTWLKDYEI